MIAPRPQSKLVYFHLRHKVLHDIHLAKGTAFSRDGLLSKHKREKHFELPTGVHMCENLRQNSNRKFKRKALIGQGIFSTFRPSKALHFPLTLQITWLTYLLKTDLIWTNGHSLESFQSWYAKMVGIQGNVECAAGSFQSTN